MVGAHGCPVLMQIRQTTAARSFYARSPEPKSSCACLRARASSTRAVAAPVVVSEAIRSRRNNGNSRGTRQFAFLRDPRYGV